MARRFFHTQVLKRLMPLCALAFVITSISASCVGNQIDSRPSADKSNRVSRLLKRLNERKELKEKPSISGKQQPQIKNPAKQKPEVQNTATKPEIKKDKATPETPKKPAKIKAKPTPVKISTTPTKKPQRKPRKKISLPSLNNFYIRADYAIGKPEKINPRGLILLETVHFKNSSMYGAGIGYKFISLLKA